MAFFNKKQEVIDIQLTPYGEELLSRGLFKPEYYAFFDDNILYDASGSAGIIEVQNDAEPRIQENTPQNKAQYVFIGSDRTTGQYVNQGWEAWGALVPMGYAPSDTLVANLEEVASTYNIASRRLTPYQLDREVETIFYTTPVPALTPNFSFVEPMGSMRLGSEYVPSWDIKVLNGELSGAINYLTSSTTTGIHSNVKRVPQLDFDINYRILVGNTTFLEIDTGLQERMISSVFEDGTFLYLSQDTPNLILAVDEENSTEEVEYDIEVFVLDRGADGAGTTFVPLQFQETPQRVVNGILLDDSEISQDPDRELDSTYAEYFFQVNTDLEIPEEEICPKITKLRSRGFLLNNVPYECPDVKRADLLDIYGSNINEDDIEDCD